MSADALFVFLVSLNYEMLNEKASFESFFKIWVENSQ